MKEYKLKINGNDYKVGIEGVSNGIVKVIVNGTHYKVEVDASMGVRKAVQPAQVAHATYQSPAPIAPVKVDTSSKPDSSGELKSPLPGTIVGVMVAVGDRVTAGQSVMVLEAMKMENNIESAKDGVVKSINKAQGDAVMEGDVLMVIE